MASNNGGLELFWSLMMMALMVAAVIAAVMALMSAGVVYGAGMGLVNYGRALRESVQPEKVAA